MNKQRKTSHILNVFQYDPTTGAVTLPASLSLATPDSTDNSTKVATTAWIRAYVGSLSYATASSVTTAIANLVASAPTTLDTLNELATALGNDPNFATTITTSIGTKVPQSRTITINGTAYDLSADRAWTIASGVTSFNTRTGAIVLSSADVTGALGFTPYNATNPSGYISGITSAMVTGALGYTPYNATNPAGYITSSGSITGSAMSLNGFAQQVEYTILNGPANGPVWKIRYDGATANRYVDLGFKDGNGVYYEGFKIYNNGTPTWAGSTIWHSGNLTNLNQLTNGPGYQTSAGSVNYANSAGAVAWTNVSGRPSVVSAFSNDVGYIGINNQSYFGINNTSSSSGNGISLYGSYSGGTMNYGIMFAGTPTYGTHGAVSGDWATYFMMNDDTTRGWIFRRNGAANVASISGAGHFSTSGYIRVASNNNLYLDWNYGQSIVGVYSSTRYQGVFAMGDSYKLAIDGSTTGNLYGLAWSHPNAGGVAGNLNTHGLLVMENGTFLAAISGNIKARDGIIAGTYMFAPNYIETNGPMYATIMYDNNDRSFYVDPNSTSRLNAVVYNDLKWVGDQSYGFLGRNVYADTINGRGSDPLEINYYDGGDVRIGTGVNGSKGLYAGALYDAGSRVAISRGEGRNYVDYSRYVYNNGAYSGSGWIEPSDLGVRYAQTAGNSSYASMSSYLQPNYVGGSQGNPQVYFNNGIGLKVAMTGAWSVWSDTVWINGYTGSDVPWMCALHFLRNSEPRMAITAQTSTSGGYGSYYEVITDYNIGSRKADGAKKLWAASHPNDYYIVNNWTGSYWQLTTNHGSAVQVGYSDNSGTASNLSGFDKTNPSFGAVYASNWFRAYGDCGLYQQDYGGHFRRNTESYGTWEMFGYNKNGWGGFVVSNNYVTSHMHNSSGDFGFLTTNGSWWNLFYNRGNNCWGIGTDNTYSGDGFRCVKYGSAEYGWTTWSDRRAKENISTITGALDTVLAMRGVYFNYIKDETKNKRVGFIAQELEQVLPEAVRYAEEIDEYSVEYAQIVSVLAEAIKEQNLKITRLEALVEQLTNN
jgi:hypothetical protein